MCKKQSRLWIAILVFFAFGLAVGVQAQDVTSIRMWVHQNDGFNAGYQALIDAYMAANPSVTITLETFPYHEYFQAIQTSMPAGTAADILQLFGTAACGYASGGRLAPLPADILTLQTANDVFYQAPVAGFTCADDSGEDTLYGVPQEFNIEYGAALVNLRLAEEAGVELPDPLTGWATWDDFRADMAKLTQDDGGFMTRAGWHFTNGDPLVFTLLSLIAQQGGEYYNDSATTFDFNTPEATVALQMMVDMVQTDRLVDPELFNDTSNAAADAFATEQAAATTIGPWVVPCCVAVNAPALIDQIAYIKLPTLGDTPVFKADSGWGLVVNGTSPVQEAAWDFISFVTLNAANALQWNIASGTLPALRENVENPETLAAFVSPQPWVEPFMEIFPYGEFIGRFPNRDEIFYSIILPNVLNAMSGGATVEESLSTITTQANASLSN
jgi:multiple sugar transport system substrate-binding protein